MIDLSSGRRGALLEYCRARGFEEEPVEEHAGAPAPRHLRNEVEGKFAQANTPVPSTSLCGSLILVQIAKALENVRSV